MSYYSPSIEKLIESFEKLPSIGHKTATRLAFHMLNLNEDSSKLSKARKDIAKMLTVLGEKLNQDQK